MPNRKPVDSVEIVLDVVRLHARRAIAEAVGPAVAVVGLDLGQPAPLIAQANPQSLVIDDGRVLLTGIPVALHAIRVAVECILEVVAAAVVDQIAGKEGAACDHGIELRTRVRLILNGGDLVAQAQDRVVLCVRAEMEHRSAAFNIATNKCVPVTRLQIDPVDTCDRIAITLRAIDVNSDERAGIHPVSRGCIRDQMAHAIDRLSEASELQVLEGATGIIAGAVNGHASLVLVAEEVAALKPDFLRAIGIETGRRTGRSCGVDGHVVHLEAHCVLGIRGIPDLNSIARAGVQKDGASQASTRGANTSQRTAMQNYVAHGRRHNDLTGRRDRGARQIDHSVGRRDRQVRRHRQRSHEVPRIAGAAVGLIQPTQAIGNLDSDVRTRELIDLVDTADLLCIQNQAVPRTQTRDSRREHCQRCIQVPGRSREHVRPRPDQIARGIRQSDLVVVCSDALEAVVPGDLRIDRTPGGGDRHINWIRRCR